MAEPRISDLVRRKLDEKTQGIAEQAEGAKPRISDLVRGIQAGQRLEASRAGVGPEIFAPGTEELTAEERFAVEFLGDTPQEKALAFQRISPGGVMLEEPGTGRLKFQRKKDRDKPFSPVDPSLKEAAQRGTLLKEFGRDVAELGGEGLSLAGETITAFVARRLGIGSRAVAVGVGGGIGESIRQEAQTLSGTQLENLTEISDRAVGAGGIGFVGSLGGDVAARGFNLLRGRGAITASPEGRTALRAQSQIPGFQEAAGLTAGQVARQPLVKSAFRQAAASVGSVQEYVNSQRRRLLAHARGVSDPKERARLNSLGAAEHAKVSKSLINEVLQKRAEFRAGGVPIRNSVRLWKETSQSEVNSLYNFARSIDEPQFDVSPAADAAREVLAGIPVQQQEGVANIALSEANGTLLKIADAMANMPAVLDNITDTAGNAVSPMQQLQSLEQVLGDLVVASFDDKAINTRDARRLYGAIRDVLDNPVETTITDDRFVPAFKKARGEAKRRFDTMETLAVVKAAETETPAQLARSLAAPGRIDSLATLRKIVPAEEWQKFQRAFRTSLIDARDINADLDRFDGPTLNLLMSKNDQRVYRALGRDLKKIDSTGFQNVAELDLEFAPVLDRIIQSGDPQAAAGLATMVKRSGGKESPFGKTVRAGLADYVFREARGIVRNTGVETLRAEQLNAILRTLGQKRLLRFFTRSELGAINNARKVQTILEQTADAGVSLQTQELAPGILEQITPGGTELNLRSGPLRRFLTNMAVGRFFTGKSGRLLVGTGRAQPNELMTLRLMGLAATELAVDDEDATAVARSIREVTGDLIDKGASLVP